MSESVERFKGLDMIYEPIDEYSVYAVQTFVKQEESQVSVVKGDALELLDDSNSYWWLIRCHKTEEIGYVPAENIETPNERLARLNEKRNVILGGLTSSESMEVDESASASASASASITPAGASQLQTTSINSTRSFSGTSRATTTSNTSNSTNSRTRKISFAPTLSLIEFEFESDHDDNNGDNDNDEGEDSSAAAAAAVDGWTTAAAVPLERHSFDDAMLRRPAAAEDSGRSGAAAIPLPSAFTSKRSHSITSLETPRSSVGPLTRRATFVSAIQQQQQRKHGSSIHNLLSKFTVKTAGSKTHSYSHSSNNINSNNLNSIRPPKSLIPPPITPLSTPLSPPPPKPHSLSSLLPPPPPPPAAALSSSSSLQTPNMIRIYRGNKITHPATFKTLKLTPTMTTKELLISTLSRFQPQSAHRLHPLEDYYLSIVVVHGSGGGGDDDDCIDEKLPLDAVVVVYLESIQMKERLSPLPLRLGQDVSSGSGSVSSSSMSSEAVLMVMMESEEEGGASGGGGGGGGGQDDSIEIKILINKVS
ncbi:hypothetical protein BDR26DRAFT_922515 [Obelidium mucronatum]|nr:hypothetical protein BDR26DRAFT_922515 [Obelidium mucronatum]